MIKSNAVVFEPHNDDFVIGMGGTGIHLLNSGWSITSVVLTDGRLGSSDLDPESTARVRAREKNAETEMLGTDWIDLGLPDKSLSRRSETADERETITSEISDILSRVEPSVVFVPAPTEGHPDHRATHDFVTSVMEREQINVSLVEYVVWDVPFFSPISTESNRVFKIGIDTVFEEKVSAIRTHESQLREYPFDEMVANFGAYLSNLYYSEGDGEYAELLHLRESATSTADFLETVGAKDVTAKFHASEE